MFYKSKLIHFFQLGEKVPITNMQKKKKEVKIIYIYIYIYIKNSLLKTGLDQWIKQDANFIPTAGAGKTRSP